MNFHFHLLINQASGSGQGKKVGDKIIALLEDKKFAHTIHLSQYPGHERKIARDLAQHTLVPWDEDQKLTDPYPLLLVIGGDGTLHQVINEFYQLNCDVPVAYIPGGSGNDFARGIGLSLKPEQAFWQIVKAKKPQSINTLVYDEMIQAETGVAVNNVGIGLDAAIVATTNDSTAKKKLNKYNLGSLSYISSILKLLFTQKGFPILVETNGNQYSFEKAFLCTTTNHPYFGGGVAIAPMAQAEKRSLDLVVVERIPMYKLFWLIIKLARKKHTTSKYFHHFTSSRLRIVSTLPQYGQADGEVLSRRPFDITFTTRNQWIWYQK
ncbi:diacylglycerol kinase family lipid kinase [Enterococcus asini]|uniref:diacylglycerol/lipid kinase family protein n=1 Tax=Enterococcus asini TaxID=57732 RepID=UPI002890ED4C|nr:diacylglycerol kinase family lipid kinase [Enterococcus asini]MDT2755985.1 diacylglycerol kinase family lipid kinase [Enterococcus asini]